MADPIARIAVRLTPGARQDRIDGWGVDSEGRPVLKARVRARPVEGAANAALIELLAPALGVPRSRVAVARGDTSRLKTIEILGLDQAEALLRLGAA